MVAIYHSGYTIDCIETPVAIPSTWNLIFGRRQQGDIAAQNPMHSLSSAANSPQLPEWYEMYFTAVLEPDESKALHQIQLASKAIADRLVELRQEAAEHPQEFQDLTSALIYLRLLFENIDTEGRGSNDFACSWITISS